MIIALLAILSFPSSAAFIAAFDPIAKKQSYEIFYQHPTPDPENLEMTYKRGADGHTISISLWRCPSQNAVDNSVVGVSVGASGTNIEHSPSGIPLGDHSFVLNNSTFIVAFADGFYTEISDGAGIRNSFAPGDAKVVEALARVAIAEMIGSTLNENGSPIQQLTRANQHTHTTYVPLSKIAGVAKAKPDVSEWLDHCSVKLGKHKLEFDLGSDMATFDGKSIVIEAFVARKKGEWMIPTKTLKQKGIEGL